MGYEIPAALGAKVACPDKTVWSIAGDGGFQMTMGELATIAENDIPVKFALINNNFLGAVRQLQDLFYGHTRVAVEYSGNPDFVKYAESYGAQGHRIESAGALVPTLESCYEKPGVHVVDVPVDYSENDGILNRDIRELSGRI